MLQGVQDPHSFSNPQQAYIKHIELDLHADFLTKRFKGTALLHVERVNYAPFIILDIDDLDITSITVDGVPVKTQLGKKEEFIGQQLVVPLPSVSKTPKVTIKYNTSPDAKGLIWREPDQTDGKVHPLVYSHSQPTYASSIYPAQHSPMLRYTYEVTLHTPKELMGLMSSDKNPTEREADGVYKFKIEQPIPSYLCAFAIGDFDFKRIGARTGVYAERVNLERAHAEFEDNEKVLTLAEERFGPYHWRTYNVLVLPVDFPAGAMENAWLSFFSGEYITGKKDRVRVVHHELSHSWFGNLVTAGKWGCLWLNEGLTTYGECILSGLIDPELAKVLSAVYYEKFLEACKTMPEALTSLKIDFSKLDEQGKVRNPRDNFSAIPYYKGFLFFKLLEQSFGLDNFNVFLRDYLEAHQFQSVTTEIFESFLLAWLGRHPEVQAPANIKEWLYAPGVPANTPQFSSTRIERVVGMVKGFMIRGVEAIASEYSSLINVELEYLIAKLAKETLSAEQIAALNQAFKFEKHPALNIREAWLVLCANKGYQPSYPALSEYVLYRKKPKLITNVFNTLVKTPEGGAVAKQLYVDGKHKFDSRGVKAAEAVLLRIGVDVERLSGLTSDLLGASFVAPMQALHFATAARAMTQEKSTEDKDERLRVKNAHQ